MSTTRPYSTPSTASTLFEIQATKIRPRRARYAIEKRSPAAGGSSPKHAAFRSQAVEVRQGMLFLKVLPGEAVAVRIINDADHDTASTVTIDGLSLLDFCDDKAYRNEIVIVKARTAGDVPGWFRDAKLSSAFLVADLPPGSPQGRAVEEPGQNQLDHRHLRRRLGEGQPVATRRAPSRSGQAPRSSPARPSRPPTRASAARSEPSARS